MRSAFLILGLMLFMGMACSSGSEPTSPALVSDLPSWQINVDGQDYNVGLGDLMGDRMVTAVTPGTNMTVAELKVYLAVYIVKLTFSPAYWCPAYRIFYPVMASQTDAKIWYYVNLMESKGYDVPNGPPPAPIC